MTWVRLMADFHICDALTFDFNTSVHLAAKQFSNLAGRFKIITRTLHTDFLFNALQPRAFA